MYGDQCTIGPGQYCRNDQALGYAASASNQHYRTTFDRLKRETLDGYVETFATCRLAAKLGWAQSSRCEKFLLNFDSFAGAEQRLRTIHSDYERRYEEAIQKAVNSSASSYGRSLASGELRPVSVNSNPALTSIPSAEKRARETQRKAAELIRAYPETRDVIENTRLKQLKRLTTPR